MDSNLMDKKRCKFGFTLAEVLVTLVIIGVIAAITVPITVNHTRNMQYKSGLKKAISSIGYAISMNWTHTGRSVSDYNSEYELFDEIFSKHMSVFDTPDQFTSDDCGGLVFRTNDGAIFCIQNFYSEGGVPGAPCDAEDSNPCVGSDEPNLWIDVNGEKAPNTMTESSSKPSDIYTAQIYSRSVIPYGEPSYEVMFK